MHSGGHLDPKTTLVMLCQRKGGTLLSKGLTAQQTNPNRIPFPGWRLC